VPFPGVDAHRSYLLRFSATGMGIHPFTSCTTRVIP
jgi:hypothetical protein